MLNFQNYRKYRLPITINPLEYGKLIYHNINFYVMFINTRNLALINQHDQFNQVKIYTNGELTFEYKDHKLENSSFVRSIEDNKFTFKNNKLISINRIILTIILISLLLLLFIISHENIYNLAIVGLSPKNIIIKKLENTYKNNKAELFIIFEFFLLFLIYLIFFVIFPEDNSNIAMAGLSSKNIIKLRRTKNKYNWEDSSFNINNKVFTKALFESIFNKFWNSIENKLNNNNHMFILFKIKYVNKTFSTIGKVQRINKSDKKWYINWIINNMEFKSEYYNETQIESFIFSYGFKQGPIKNKENIIENINFQNYKNYNLPISMNPLDYGRLIIQNKTESSVNYIIQNDKGLTINFNQFDKYNEIEFFRNGISLIKFTDISINNDNFIRKIDNKKYYFENNQQILFTSEMKSRFISKTVKSKNLSNNFITLDIETFVQDNTLIPYLICFYDGKNTYSFGLWDYETVEMMILDCLKSIFIRKYNGFNVYIHNMAKFDIIFLLKYLVKIVNVQPVIHNGRIISLSINYGKDLEYRIQFKDSYLILLNSLSRLCKAFSVSNPKSLFPYLFVNEDNLNYIGDVPEFKYFIKISKSEYQDYKSSFNLVWNLRDEALKYCELDCISLYQVLIKFNSMIFELFSKNIHKYPTLPSLAFAIFRSNFMSEENIPQLSGKIANDIRQGYTGGAVDVYIPKPSKGVKIRGYDVNSLYPKQMFDRLMPIGVPTYFEGNIRSIDPQAFGFFYCEVIVPDNINHPIIQTHVKINNMTRTIAPIGQWSDMLFSMEMDNAMKYGYKFNILWGYTFEKGYIFKNYVDFLYNLRLNYSKSDPLNYIAKILLNSLYGRFGMDDNFTNINIIHKDYYADFENKFFEQIEDKIDLGNHMLVFYNTESFNEEDNSTHNVSIGIAAAITAYSRIHMSQFKNNPKINLYYTDTDSIYTDSDLDESFISNKILGKMKLEHVINKAIFLSPKVYYLETEDSKVIYKVKGLKHEIELTKNDFESLLYKDAFLEKNQTKWRKHIEIGNISVIDQLYTLKVTDNKRKLIYDNNKLIGSSSYIINNDEIINK